MTMDASTCKWDDVTGDIWDDVNNDVHPACQLSYGHVIVEKQDVDILRKRIEKLFHLPQPIHVHETLEQKDFPLKDKLFSLRDDYTLHFVYVILDKYVFLFSSHVFFYDSKLWIKLSKKHRCFLALCVRFDASEFNYLVFNKGELCLNLNKNDQYKTTYLEKGFQVSILQQKKTIATSRYKGFTENDEKSFMPDFDLCLCQKGNNIKLYDLGKKTYLDVGISCRILHAVYSTEPTVSLLQQMINKLKILFK